MDKPTPDKNLKDLLNKPASESFDDFEKEALEGFNTLGSEQEALDLKAALDKRMQAEVFPEKKSEPKVYWYAAAGLALIIGLSTYFLMNNDPVKNDNVAIIQNEERADAPVDMPKKEVEKLVEKQNAAPLAEEKEPEDKRTQNRFANTAKPSGTGAVSGGTYTVTVADANGAVATNKNVPESVDGDTKDASKKVSDDLKKLKSEEKSPVETAAMDKDQEGDALEQPIDKTITNSDVQTKNKKSVFRAENKGKLADQKSETEPQNKQKMDGAATDELAGKKDNEDSREKNRRKDKKEDEENKAAEVKQTNEVVNNSIALKSQVAKETINTAGTKAPASPALAESTKENTVNGAPGYAQICYYQGGDNTLEKDIREKLIEKKLNKRFDAILFINDKKAVESVTFTNKYELNKDDEIHIAETLKTLNRFIFSINPKENTLFEYKLLYRP